MHHIIVSYATRPGHGSEGGVGWAFVRAAGEYARSRGQNVHAIVDARDASSLAGALQEENLESAVNLVPVSVPTWMLSRIGDARTRASYLTWRPRAIAAAKDVRSRVGRVSTIHQVTFASAVLPHALPKSIGAKRIWGPVSVPGGWGSGVGRWSEKLMVSLARRLGRFNTFQIDLVIATNSLTAQAISRGGELCIVEPNIVVDVDESEIGIPDPNLISYCGLLEPLKRPVLAIQAMADPRLANYHLQVIGDGSLRTELERAAKSLGVQNRIAFKGRVPRDEAIRLLAKSRLLLHPSVREGASWVVGEAAAVGVPAVVFSNVGAASTVDITDNGGVLARPNGSLSESLAAAAVQVLERPAPEPSSRWSSARLPGLLEKWWMGA